MNKEIFTIENVVNALEIDIGIKHKSNLVRFPDPLDITGTISFFHDDKEALYFELFENCDYSISGYMSLKTDINGNIICPIQINNKDYLKKLNELNKFYSLFILLNQNNESRNETTPVLNMHFVFNEDIQIITDKTCIALSLSNGTDIILDIEYYIRKILAANGIEDQLETNSPEEIFSLIEMVRI